MTSPSRLCTPCSMLTLVAEETAWLEPPPPPPPPEPSPIWFCTRPPSPPPPPPRYPPPPPPPPPPKSGICGWRPLAPPCPNPPFVPVLPASMRVAPSPPAPPRPGRPVGAPPPLPPGSKLKGPAPVAPAVALAPPAPPARPPNRWLESERGPGAPTAATATGDQQRVEGVRARGTHVAHAPAAARGHRVRVLGGRPEATAAVEAAVSVVRTTLGPLRPADAHAAHPDLEVRPARHRQRGLDVRALPTWGGTGPGLRPWKRGTALRAPQIESRARHAPGHGPGLHAARGIERHCRIRERRAYGEPAHVLPEATEAGFLADSAPRDPTSNW